MDLYEVHEQIRQVLYRYCRLMDTKNTELIAGELFTKDATVDVGMFGDGGDHFEGQEQLVELFAMHPKMFESTAHLIGQVHITVQSDGDRATCDAYVSAWHWLTGKSAEGPERPADNMTVGRLVDELVKNSSGEWRVAARRMEVVGGINAIGSFDQPVME